MIFMQKKSGEKKSKTPKRKKDTGGDKDDIAGIILQRDKNKSDAPTKSIEVGGKDKKPEDEKTAKNNAEQDAKEGENADAGTPAFDMNAFNAFMKAMGGESDEMADLLAPPNIPTEDAVENKERTVEDDIMEGEFSAALGLDKRSLKVFVSSTFSDTKAERNYLMREVYPRIRQFCSSIGIDFSVVDFRWGIRDQVSNDHLTTEICLAEIDKCYKQSIEAPCFVFLSFSRYGWTPLPRVVDATEFEVIKVGVKDEERKKLIEQWYRKDKNAVPPVFVLQPIATEIPEFTQQSGIEYKRWFYKVT